jgi:hypothetical protein
MKALEVIKILEVDYGWNSKQSGGFSDTQKMIIKDTIKAVNEETCRWNKIKGFKYYAPSCNDSTMQRLDYTHCPYCGRLIKEGKYYY